MAVFTKESAAEAARKSHLPWSARFLQKEPEPQKPDLPQNQSLAAGLTAEQETVREQIRLLDRDFLTTNDPALRVRISDAKSKLWQLIHPRPGVLKPTSRRSTPSQDPSPVEIPTQPIVSSAPIVPPADPGSTPPVQ